MQSDFSSSDYLHVSGRACPDCGGDVDRIPRRFIDRISSAIVYSQRYRCRGFSCRWEGNLREDKRKRKEPSAAR